MHAFLGEAKEWARGRAWLPRTVLLLICGWILLRHLRDPMYGGIVKGLNLAIHEIGHVLFGFVGEFVGIAGGTILQLAAPLIAAWLFYRQRDFFAIAIALCWLGTSCFDVAVYAADARAGDLPLVGLGGGDPEHDWFIMLAETNLLYHDRTVGALFRGLGFISFAGGLALGAWIARVAFETRVRAVALVGLLLLSTSCALPFKNEEMNRTTAGLTWKPVSDKRDPVYLIAVDGTECTVSAKRYQKVKRGDNVFCLWSSPR